MFGGDDDDNYSVLSLDLASDSLTKRKGSANVEGAGSNQASPHWSARYGANSAQQHMRAGSESSTLSSAARSNPHSRQTSATNGGSASPQYGGQGDFGPSQRDMEDEFGWSGSAGGIKGRDDRQVLRDQEFERQIEDRRRRRLARKQGKSATTAPDAAPTAAAAPAADEPPQKEGTVKLRKAYRPVFAPTARDELSLDSPKQADQAATAVDADASTPVIPPPPRKGVTLVDDGVVEPPPPPPPEPVQDAQPAKFSRSRSFRLKRPNILRSHSDLVRGSNAAPAADQRLNASVGPGAYVAGQHYAFLDSPHSSGSTPVNGAGGLKRGMSLKDKLGSALGRFGSTRRPTPGEAAAMPPMRRKTSRPPADGPLAEGDEGNGGPEASGSGFGGLVRRMSKKLSEDPERVERHRREALYYEPPKLSHVLVGDRSPFPPRPPLGALSTAADQPPSFTRATGGRPSSYARTPYDDEKKTSPI